MKRSICLFIFSFVSLAMAKEQPLVLSTNTSVTEDGRVQIYITVKNIGRKTLYDVQPMIHFHHTMAMMPKIAKLEPHQKITLENGNHPPVLRSGRYPLVIMTQHKENSRMESHTHIHTDSFYFREQVESAIDGKIKSFVNGDESLLDIFLKNNSASFKNIRLMLLLPPGLMADGLGQMMGLTIRGGQEKNIKVAIKRKEGSAAEIYPIHLLIEYGEMLNHYTGDVSGEIDFRSIHERIAIIPALGAILALGCFLLFRSYKKKKNQPYLLNIRNI